jgi:hypothetical protein
MIKPFTLITLSLLCVSISVKAQYKIVSFDYERASFNENQPLPAETHILIQSSIPDNITYVELFAYEAKGKEDRNPSIVVAWKRPIDKEVDKFSLPMHYKLRGNSDYDFKVNYYSPISEEEKSIMKEQMHKQLDDYIEQKIVPSKSHIQLSDNYKHILADLNQMVKKNLENYRSRTAIEFEGFSDLIKNNLHHLGKTNLRSGRFLFIGKTKDEAKDEYRKKLIEGIKSQIHNELDLYLNVELAKLTDSRYINDYATEKIRRTIAIQGGYGGVYADGNFSSLTLGNGPYFGLAFPLGRRAFTPKIISNTSICFGAYLTNFKGIGLNNGNISGPIFKRPTYVGLSYKVYQFIQLNAGATFLEDASTAGQFNGIGTRIYIRPNIGLSIQFQFWADLSR